jgi:hypothetical protein
MEQSDTGRDESDVSSSPAETDAGDGTTTDPDDDGAPAAIKGDDSTDPGPTPQSAALRRQQRSIGVAGALVGGVALATATFQRFPETPALAAGAGVAGATLVLLLVRRSIFPGESASAD